MGEEKLPSKYSSHTFAVLNVKNARKKVPSNISLPASALHDEDTYGGEQYILKYTCAKWFETSFFRIFKV